MRGLYLIAPQAAAELRAARSQAISAESIQLFGRRASSSSGMPEILQVVDGVAQIAVNGVLTAKPDIWAWLFAGGNTTYPDLQQSLRLAAADPSVREVVLLISSPGGEVSGLFELLQDLAAFAKPMRSRASSAQSAAFGIAAASGPIEAATEASMFGSVGVATAMYIDDSIVDLTNADSPNKRPNPSTPEGKAVVQAELDSIFELFASAIARGRSTSLETVRSSYGRGATLLAGQARAAGMIDSIAPAPTKPTPAARATAAAPSDGLSGLLAQRLEGETSEQHVARCSRLLAAMGQPTPTPPTAPTRQALAASVHGLTHDMPLAYPSGIPAGAAGVIAAMAAMPAIHAPAPTPVEPAPTPTALAAAVQRLSDLEWATPTPTAPARAAAPPPAPPGPELGAAIEALMEEQVAS